MADDETIIIRVNAAQGEAALKALGQAGIEAGKGVEQVGVSAQKSDLNLKDLTRNIGAGISLLGILRENLDALKPALESVGNGIKFAAVQAGASEKTVSNLSLAVDSLIHPSHIAANAVESLKRAWGEFEEEVVGSSTVIPNGVRTIEESLAALEKARAKAAGEKAAALEDEQKALVDTAKEEAALEEAAIKSADARAKAAQEAAAAVVAALEEERKALDAKLAQDEARLEAALGKGGKIDTSQDADEAKREIADLRQEIKRLEDQPTLDSEQLNKLNELKDRAGKAAAEVRDLGKTFTQTADDFLTEGEAADAASAAWDVYGDRLKQAQNRHEDAIRSMDDSEESLSEVADTAEEAGESLSDAAEAAKDLGDEGKKGADKATGSLSDLKAGAEEALPILQQCRDVLKEMDALSSGMDI